MNVPGIPPGMSDDASKSLAGIPTSIEDATRLLYPNDGDRAWGVTADSASSAGSTTSGVSSVNSVDSAMAKVFGMLPFVKNSQNATFGGGGFTGADTGSVAGGADGGVASWFGGGGGSDMTAAFDMPVFATGTPPLTAGTMAMIGEDGPEVAYVPKGIGIVPNNKVDRIFGDGRPNLTINTNGGITREEMRMTVQNAISTYHSQVAGKSAVMSNHDHTARRPGRAK